MPIPSPSIQVLRIVGAGWHIAPVTDHAWDAAGYHADQDDLLRDTGLSYLEFLHELQAVISYRLGRDQRGFFRGRITVNVDDDRYEPFFGRLDQKREKDTDQFRWRDPAEYRATQREHLVPLSLTDVRHALHFAIRPEIETSGPLGFYRIQAAMGEGGFTIFIDDENVCAILEAVLPSYGVRIDLNSSYIAEIISSTDPIDSFDP